jgi:hypothetical protein
VVISLDMIPARQEVNIAMEPYLGVARKGRSLNDCDCLVKSRDAMFDQLISWVRRYERFASLRRPEGFQAGRRMHASVARAW